MANELPPTQHLPEVSSGPVSSGGVSSGADEPQRGPAMSAPVAVATKPTSDTPDDDAPRKRRGLVSRRVGRWTGRAFWLAVVAGVNVLDAAS